VAKHVGFDADQDCSHVAALAASKNVEFVCRYLKNLTLAEVNAITGAGLWLVSIFESTASRALSGFEGGVADGQEALDQASALGQPQNSAIYFTADFGETALEDATVLAYFTGANQQLVGSGFLGVYGEGALFPVTQSVAKFFWVAGGRGMRGTQALLDAGTATMVQDVGDKQRLNLGINIDSDTAFVDNYGQWKPGLVFQPLGADVP
jgi:hypothetical protein